MLRPLLIVYMAGFLVMFWPLLLDWARERRRAARRARRLNATSLERGEGRPFSVDWRWKELGKRLGTAALWFAIGPMAAWRNWFEED